MLFHACSIVLNSYIFIFHCTMDTDKCCNPITDLNRKKTIDEAYSNTIHPAISTIFSTAVVCFRAISTKLTRDCFPGLSVSDEFLWVANSCCSREDFATTPATVPAVGSARCWRWCRLIETPWTRVCWGTLTPSRCLSYSEEHRSLEAA